MSDPQIEDLVSRIMSHLTIAPDAYLIGPADFNGAFTMLDRASLENMKTDALPTLPGDRVQLLESSERIVRFAVADSDKIGFRVPEPQAFRKL